MNALKISLCALVSLFLLVTTFYIINPFGQDKPVEAALSADEVIPAVAEEMASTGTPVVTVPSDPAVAKKSSSLAAADQPAAKKIKSKIPKERRIKEALELEERRTKDLALGYIPRERLVTALEETRRRQLEL